MCLQLAHSDVHADRIQRHDHDNTREHSHGGNRCVARAMSRRRRLLQRRLCQRPCSAVGDRAGVVARIHTPRYDDQQWLKANRIKPQQQLPLSTFGNHDTIVSNVVMRICSTDQENKTETSIHQFLMFIEENTTSAGMQLRETYS